MPDVANDSTTLANEKRLLAAQLFIQTNLDGDLSVRSVARAVGASESHFHRLFKARLGETIKKYVDRLRVEKSFYDIKISNLSLLQIALRYGFKNHETYSRTFKRHFGRPPSHFLGERPPARRAGAGKRPEQPEIGVGLRYSPGPNFSVTRLAALHVAFIRHIGAYEGVPLINDSGNSPWRALEAFAQETLGATKPHVYLGIPHDSPATTAPDKLRFDTCLLVKEPFQPRGTIGYLNVPAGYYGVLTHAGPYATLAEAYGRLFELAAALRNFVIAPGIVFELLLNISATSIDDHTWTELYLPLIPRGMSL